MRQILRQVTAYEAGPTGFGLARQLTAAGIRCVVAAPSKLQRPPGDRVKTDSRDAQHLARLLRMDQIVEVRVPGVEQEAATLIADKNYYGRDFETTLTAAGTWSGPGRTSAVNGRIIWLTLIALFGATRGR